MKCTLCETGMLKEGVTTVVLTRDEAVVILKQVPALICGQCGHYHLESPMARLVLEKANDAMSKGLEVEILSLKAA
jgi:YgiT-type zinc finger domain-containing protein